MVGWCEKWGHLMTHEKIIEIAHEALISGSKKGTTFSSRWEIFPSRAQRSKSSWGREWWKFVGQFRVKPFFFHQSFFGSIMIFPTLSRPFHLGYPHLYPVSLGCFTLTTQALTLRQWRRSGRRRFWVLGSAAGAVNFLSLDDAMGKKGLRCEIASGLGLRWILVEAC